MQHKQAQNVYIGLYQTTVLQVMTM